MVKPPIKDQPRQAAPDFAGRTAQAEVSRTAPGGLKMQQAQAVAVAGQPQGHELARITPVKVPAWKAKIGSGGQGQVSPMPDQPEERQRNALPQASNPNPGLIAAPKVEDEIGDMDDSPRKSIIAGLAIVAFFFGGLGTWAAWAPLEGATIVPGAVRVEGQAKTVQHPDGGVIKDILVREGEKVKANQVLLKLDDTTAATNLNVLLNQYYALRAQEARLVAEMNHSPSIAFPQELLARQSDPQVQEALSGQKALFAARATMLTGQGEVLRKRIGELQEQIRGGRAQAASHTQQRQSIAAELKSVQPLVESGVVTRTRVLDLERAQQRLMGEEQEILARIARDEQTIEQTKQQIMQGGNERVSQVAGELRETQNRLADVETRLQQARDVYERTEIRSPAEGKVLALSVATRGAVVQRGEKLMDIIPDEQRMVIEGMVQVNDIAYVHQGMKAQVRLTSYRQRDVPVIWGEITNISADRILDPRSGMPFYRVEVRLSEDDMKLAKGVQLYPGMPATVMVPMGKRTAMDYFLQPLTDSLSVAFRER